MSLFIKQSQKKTKGRGYVRPSVHAFGPTKKLKSINREEIIRTV
jgi:hypothetical protein